jgi:hypothetical protein
MFGCFSKRWLAGDHEAAHGMVVQYESQLGHACHMMKQARRRRASDDWAAVALRRAMASQM